MNLDQLIREADPARDLDIRTPDPPLISTNGRSEKLQGLPALGIAVAVVVVVAIGASLLRHGGPSQPERSQASGAQPLLRILGVLRRPQTKADLPPALLRLLRTDSRFRLPRVFGTPDLDGIRLATVTPRGEQVFLIPDKPATSAAISKFISYQRAHGASASALDSRVRALAAAGYNLQVALLDRGRVGRGTGLGVETARAIQSGEGTDAAIFNKQLQVTSGEVILVVPDGVAKVAVLVHDGTNRLIWVTGPVRNNVLAVRVPGVWYDEGVLKMIWYAPTGKVLRRFCEQCHFAQWTPKRPIKALSRLQANAFAILDRPRRPADALPAQFVATQGPALERQHGVNLDLARAAVTPGAKIWLMPGAGSMCVRSVAVAAKLGGLGCSSTAAAEAGGMTTSGSRDYPGKTFVSGIARNGATSVTVRLGDGKQATLRVVDNAYGGIINGSPASAEMHYTSGTTTPLQVP